ncbi:MAG: RNA methyltransferase [Ruminococcus sp.]|jgi:TrmH family RNA methyltransferase|nr:RNA methyltransferase [Ruminococcus sp.]
MYIISADNLKIKEYIKLAKHKKYRDELGLFVLEGERLVFDAIESGIVPERVFCTEKSSAHFEEPFIITDSIAERISQTKSTQGIFAVCKKPDCKLALDGKAIVLAGLQDPGNIGMIIRTAAALGISDIISVNTADIFSPKCTRAAMGSLFHVNICETDTPFELLSGYTTYAAVLGDVTDVRKVKFAPKSAIIIGNEANGIPDEIANRADMSITINMSGAVESLNAAAAASILIWELRREA